MVRLSAFDELAAIAPHRIWDGVRGRVVQGERVTLSVIELEPGCVVPEHSHDNEQLGFVVSGALEFRVGGERRDLAPGGTWCIPANVPHDVRGGPEGAVVIEVFAPARRDWEQLEREPPSAPSFP